MAGSGAAGECDGLRQLFRLIDLPSSTPLRQGECACCIGTIDRFGLQAAAAMANELRTYYIRQTTRLSYSLRRSTNSRRVTDGHASLCLTVLCRFRRPI